MSVMTIKLSRAEGATWGFRLQGGKDFATPLCIQKVNSGSVAAVAGLQAGDAIVTIGGRDALALRHKEAQEAIVRAGNTFDLVVQRGSQTWKPQVTPLAQVKKTPEGVTVATKTSLAANKQVNGQQIVNAQYNTPLNLYSEDNIAETLSAQAEVLGKGCLGINFKKYARETVIQTESPTYKLIHGDQEESKKSRPPIKTFHDKDPEPAAEFPRPKPAAARPQPPPQAAPQPAQQPGYYNINEKLYCDVHAKQAARHHAPGPNMEPVVVKPGAPLPSGAMTAPMAKVAAAPEVAPPQPAPDTEPVVEAAPEPTPVQAPPEPEPEPQPEPAPAPAPEAEVAPAAPLAAEILQAQTAPESEDILQQEAQTHLEPCTDTQPETLLDTFQMEPYTESEPPVELEPGVVPEQTLGSEPSAPVETQASSESAVELEQTIVPEPVADLEPIVLEPVPEPTVVPEPAVEPELTIEPEPAVEPELTIEPEMAVEPEPAVEPELTIEPDPTVDPEPAPEESTVYDPAVVPVSDGVVGGTSVAMGRVEETRGEAPAPLAAPQPPPSGPQMEPAPIRPAPVPVQAPAAPMAAPPSTFTPFKAPAAPAPQKVPAPFGAPAGGVGVRTHIPKKDPAPVFAPAMPKPSPMPDVGGIPVKGAPTSGQRSAPRRGKGVMNPSNTARIPICADCNRQIRGPFVSALGKTWCPDHFVCSTASCRHALIDMGFVEEQGALHCEDCYEKYFAPICGKCDKRVKGDCLNAVGKQFHPECFCCAYCGKVFGSGAFYLEDGLPYCEADWNDLFTTKCVGCGFPIEAGDRWVEALNNNYHSQCFKCSKCHKNLEGQSFFAKGGKPFCKAHAQRGI